MNTNCLAGMQCPNCGSLEPFYMEVQCIALMYDNGSESLEDLEWDDKSACWCGVCKHKGTVKHFSRKGKANDHS
jgi:hypothetical protein